MTDPWWTPDPPWLHETRSQGGSGAVLARRPEGARVFTLRGTRMRSHDSLFREFATELRFPGYFGANWPALADCLGDLLWFEELPHMLLVIEDWPSVLADAPIDLPVLTRILNDTAADWARLGYDGTGANPVAFNTVLLT